MKEFTLTDQKECLIVEAFYSYAEYEQLVDDFIYYLHNAECWKEESKIPAKELCICFRVFFKQELKVSVKDNKPVFQGVGINFIGVGRIHEDNEMAVSSETNFERGEC